MAAKNTSWTGKHDEALKVFMQSKGASIRKAEVRFCMSRSFLHRRLAEMNLTCRPQSCSLARQAAGWEPLPTGHPLAMSAILLPLISTADRFSDAVSS
ncbi:hypothetical protein AOE01nite_29360 [Acetobacter oeni]|uniref:Uncharacterized protein n=1 Tax=Acetobacter oeni TaxID=304077 RepID=A0A511XP12_9PROT|nr:hypothetical protein [Acetobacter oeni]GBR00508.1 hypothetical protein AA21952_0123 [Acetobacter oeni LMG 21952]GEN64712.1 hypothetical protein AOE01nite_29360 [Acetobacter oeni]